MPLISVWLQFFGLGCIIGIAGYYLCYYADIIADRTGLGRNWIGVILLATVTSLPELISGISAIRFADDGVPRAQKACAPLSLWKKVFRNRSTWMIMLVPFLIFSESLRQSDNCQRESIATIILKSVIFPQNIEFFIFYP